MSIPNGDNALLHELELDVRAELTLIEASQPEEEAAGIPIDKWLSHPADNQRYEVDVRSLLDAVEVWRTAPAPAGAPRRKVGERCRARHSTWWTYCG